MYGFGAHMTDGYGWSTPCLGYSDGQEYGWDWQQDYEEAEGEDEVAGEDEEVESGEPRCRNGRNCMFLARGTCKYHHPPSHIECRNGPNCEFFAEGTCTFYHPETSLAELESKLPPRKVGTPTKQTPTKSAGKRWNVLVLNTPGSETTRLGPCATLHFEAPTQTVDVSTALLSSFKSAFQQEAEESDEISSTSLPVVGVETPVVIAHKPEAKASDVEKDVVVVSVTPVSKVTACEPRSRTPPRASLFQSPKSQEDSQEQPMRKASQACSNPKSRQVCIAEPRSRTPRGTMCQSPKSTSRIVAEELCETPKISTSPASLLQSPKSKRSRKSPNSNRPKGTNENAAPSNSPGGATTPLSKPSPASELRACTPENSESPRSFRSRR